MSRRNLTIFGLVVAVAVILSAAGVGYAVYMGNTYSEHNTMDVDKSSIDVFKDGQPINTPISMPAFVKNGSVSITGYRVATTGPGSFTLQCQMSNGACWALIDSMTLEITDSNGTVSYEFGIDRDADPIRVGLPTSSIAMTDDEDHHFTYDEKTLLYYDFVINISFSDIDVTIDPQYETLSTFEGAKFMFVFTPTSS